VEHQSTIGIRLTDTPDQNWVLPSRREARKNPAGAGLESGSSGFQGPACHTTSFDRSPESPTRYAVMRNLGAMESTGLVEA